MSEVLKSQGAGMDEPLVDDEGRVVAEGTIFGCVGTILVVLGRFWLCLDDFVFIVTILFLLWRFCFIGTILFV